MPKPTFFCKELIDFNNAAITYMHMNFCNAKRRLLKLKQQNTILTNQSIDLQCLLYQNTFK